MIRVTVLTCCDWLLRACEKRTDEAQKDVPWWVCASTLRARQARLTHVEVRASGALVTNADDGAARANVANHAGVRRHHSM